MIVCIFPLVRGLEQLYWHFCPPTFERTPVLQYGNSLVRRCEEWILLTHAYKQKSIAKREIWHLPQRQRIQPHGQPCFLTVLSDYLPLTYPFLTCAFQYHAIHPTGDAASQCRAFIFLPAQATTINRQVLTNDQTSLSISSIWITYSTSFIIFKHDKSLLYTYKTVTFEPRMLMHQSRKGFIHLGCCNPAHLRETCAAITAKKEVLARSLGMDLCRSWEVQTRRSSSEGWSSLGDST